MNKKATHYFMQKEELEDIKKTIMSAFKKTETFPVKKSRINKQEFSGIVYRTCSESDLRDLLKIK